MTSFVAPPPPSQTPYRKAAPPRTVRKTGPIHPLGRLRSFAERPAAGEPEGEWRMLAPRIHDQEYDVDQGKLAGDVLDIVGQMEQQGLLAESAG